MFNIENPSIRVDDQARLGPISMMLVSPPTEIEGREGLAESIITGITGVPTLKGGRRNMEYSEVWSALESARKLVEDQARTIETLKLEMAQLKAPKPTWKDRIAKVLNTDIRDIIRWLLH